MVPFEHFNNILGFELLICSDCYLPSKTYLLIVFATLAMLKPSVNVMYNSHHQHKGSQ